MERLTTCPSCHGAATGPAHASGACWYCNGAGIDLAAYGLDPTTPPQTARAIARQRARQRRLAAQAAADGVWLIRQGGRWYATSRSQPGVRHYLTAWSCTCKGFLYTGECGHHSLLLARLGWLDATVTPSETAVAA